MTSVRLFLNPLPKNQPAGLSKLFGDPDVNEGFEWPSIIDEDDIYDLAFVMQLNLADFSDTDTKLPKKGMLYFFYDMDASAFSPYDTEACRVIYSDDESREPLYLEDEDGKSLAYRSYGLEKKTDAESDGDVVLFPDEAPSAPINGWIALASIASVKTSPFSDGGRLVFFISPDALEKKDFSDVRIMIKNRYNSENL